MSDETASPDDEPAKSVERTRFRRELRRWRWPLIGLAVVLVLVALIYVAVPLGIRYAATSELEAMGARDVKIGAVDFDPFDAAATISDLAVTGSDGDRLTADRLTVYVDFGDLFARRIHLPEVAVEGALLDVRRLETGGILFAGLAPLADEQVEEEEEAGWQFGFGKLEIARSRLHYAEPDFETTFVLDDLSFGRVLAWQPDEVADFRFSGTLGDSTLSAEGTAMPFAAVNRGDIQLDLSALDLSAFETVLRDAGLPQIDGMVAARIALTTALSADEPPKIAIEGRIEATGVSLGLDEGALSGDRAVWSGRIAYDGAREDYLELDGSLEAKGLRLPASDGPVSAGGLNWDGRIALSEPDEDTMTLKLAGTAGLDGVAAGDGGSSEVTVGSVRLRGLASTVVLGPDGGFGLDQTGRVELSGIVAQESGRTVKLETLSWNGKAVQSADGAKLSLHGALAAETLSVQAEQAGETASVEKVELTESFFEMTRASMGVDISHTGPMVVTGGRLETPDATAQEARVEWSGQFSGRVADDGALDGELDGALRTEEVVIRLTAPTLSLRYDSLVFEGKTTVEGTADGAITSRTAGRTAIEKLSLTDEGRALEIISIDKIAVEGVQGTEKGLTGADSLEASDIRVGVPVPDQAGAADFVHRPMHIGQVRIERVGTFDATAMRLGEVRVTDLSLTAVRDKEGLIQLPIVFTVDSPAPAAEAAAPAGEAPAGASGGQAAAQSGNGTGAAPGAAGQTTDIAIERLTVDGQSDLSFVDLGFDPNFEKKLDKFAFAMNGLDSAQPGKSAQLEFSGALGEFSTVTASGTVSPFADQASTDLKIQLDGLNLPPLSVYSARYLGYRLDTGELDAIIDLKVVGTDLTAEANLDIRQLTLDLEQNSELEALRKELGIPIETGLDLLRNADGDIALSVPISGELGNPQFDFSDAINQAIGSAMKDAVLTILFPLGAVIAATDGSGSSNIMLDPVVFEAGSAELAGGGKELLAKAAEFLGGRTGIKIRLCGYAVPGDKDALASQAQAAGTAEAKPAEEDVETTDEGAPAAPATGVGAPEVSQTALDNLASERAIRVKSLLVEDYGIDPKRLLLCRPRVDDGAATPRVEILL